MYVYVYRAPSGQWSGKLLEEVGGVAGCDSREEALAALRDQYPSEALDELPEASGAS